MHAETAAAEHERVKSAATEAAQQACKQATQQNEQSMRALVMMSAFHSQNQAAHMAAQASESQARLDAAHRHGSYMMWASMPGSDVAHMPEFLKAVSAAAPLPQQQIAPPPPQQQQGALLGMLSSSGAASTTSEPVVLALQHALAPTLAAPAPSAAAPAPSTAAPLALPPSEVARRPRFCGDCGSEFGSGDSRFCSNCGTQRA